MPLRKCWRASPRTSARATAGEGDDEQEDGSESGEADEGGARHQ